MIGKKRILNTTLATAGGLVLCLMLTHCSPNAANISKDMLRATRAGSHSDDSAGPSIGVIGPELTSTKKAEDSHVASLTTLWLDEDTYAKKIQSLPEDAPKSQIDSFEMKTLLALDQFKQTGRMDIELSGGSLDDATIILGLDDRLGQEDTSEDIPLVLKSISENKWRISFDTNLKTKGAYDRIEQITAVTLVFQSKEKVPARLSAKPIPGPAS